MAALLAAAVRDLDHALLASRAGGADAAADAAIKGDRRLERVCRAAMAELVAVDDMRDVMARRELYRRGSRIGEAVVDVAERIQYAIVKES